MKRPTFREFPNFFEEEKVLTKWKTLPGDKRVIKWRHYSLLNSILLNRSKLTL